MSDSLLTQLRARETMRLHVFPHITNVHSSIHRHRILSDTFTPFSYAASRIRSLPSHFQHILLGHTGCVNAVAVSSGVGEFVATGGDDLRVLLWNAYAPLREIYPKEQKDRIVASTAANAHETNTIDPDIVAAQTTTASSSFSRPHHSFRAGFISQPFTQSYLAHSANIFSLAFSPDTRHILSCGLDAQIHLYDITTGGGDAQSPASRSFKGHQSSVHRVCYQADSSDVFLSASNDRTVRVFDIRAGAQAQFAGGFSYGLNSVATNPVDPNMFVTAGRALCLHDMRKMTPTSHNVGLTQLAGATPTAAPRVTRQQARIREEAIHFAERTRFVLEGNRRAAREEREEKSEEDGEDDEDVPDSERQESKSESSDDMEDRAAAAAATAYAGEDSDTEEAMGPADFQNLVEFIVSGGNHARPIATLMQYDLSTMIAHPPKTSKAAAATTRRTTRSSAAAASSSASSSTRGTRSGGRRGRSRSRPAATRDDTSAAAAAAAEPDEYDEAVRRMAGRSGSARSGRGRRGASASAAAATDSSSSSSRPSRRRFAAMPTLDASSCEFSNDGRQIAVCMMEGKPMLFDTESKHPVVCMHSIGDFSGYKNTCTMKSVVFAGDNDRFVVGGSDNFGLYVWDRKLLSQDIIASPATNDENTATFLNACKIIRGHRSVANNQRYHPRLRQLFSCGVEKVVRAFHLTRSAVAPPGVEEMEDGDIISTSIATAASSSSPTSDRKRKLTSSNEDELREEKKTKSEESATESTNPSPTQDGDVDMDTDGPITAESAAASSSPTTASRPRRRAAVQAEATISAASGPRRRSARHRSASSDADAASAAAATTSAIAASASVASSSTSSSSPPFTDPLYRMVRQYFTPRQPYSRLQCSFILNGHAAWSFGQHASLFADGLEDDQPVDDSTLQDENGETMAEDRQCIAQFDMYLSKGGNSDPFGRSDLDSNSDDEDEEEDDSEEDDDDTASSDDDQGRYFELTPAQIVRLGDELRARAVEVEIEEVEEEEEENENENEENEAATTRPTRARGRGGRGRGRRT